MLQNSEKYKRSGLMIFRCVLNSALVFLVTQMSMTVDMLEIFDAKEIATLGCAL